MKKLKRGLLSREQQNDNVKYVIKGCIPDSQKSNPKKKGQNFTDWYKKKDLEKVYGLSLSEIKKIIRKGVNSGMSTDEIHKYCEASRAVEQYLDKNQEDSLISAIKKERDKISVSLKMR